MPRLSPRARLTPSLLKPQGWLAAETLCLALTSRALDFADAPGIEAVSPARLAPLFCAKRIDAAAAAPGHPTRAQPRPGCVSRFSLRLTAERRARMTAAAKRLRQSCQAVLTDALDAHLERLAPGDGLPSAL